jgi:hypothetical protein
LRREKLIVRTYCEQAEQLATVLHGAGVGRSGNHEIVSERDLAGLLRTNIGIGIVPASSATLPGVRGVHINGLELNRTVYLYGVAGRARSAAASTLMKLLRAADWPAMCGSAVEEAVTACPTPLGSVETNAGDGA